jgi:hypothetical protein
MSSFGLIKNLGFLFYRLKNQSLVFGFIIAAQFINLFLFDIKEELFLI